jgi:predicted DNA-binding transcriptional regulator AlpA
VDDRGALEALLEQLIDSAEVSEILGLSDQRAVSVYQRRYPEMPRPVMDRGKNRVKLWYKPEILDWSRRNGLRS